MTNTNQTAIAAAVEPLRSVAMERARKEAADLVERTFAKYTEDPKAYAYPSGIWGKREYSEQKSRYSLIGALTVSAGSYHDGYKQIRSDEKVEKFISDAVEMASMQYTAFVQKLENKVGEHIAAVLTGNHVWGYSVLSVTKADGSIENWKTQQIVNVSALGKLFNQWPSRKVK